MKKIILSCVLLLSGILVFAQDCDLKLQTARDARAAGKYKEAVKYYKRVLKDCGDYDGNVAKELRECEKKLNDMVAVFALKQPKLECSGEGGTLVMELSKAPDLWSVFQVPDWMQELIVIPEDKKAQFHVSANPMAEVRKGVIVLKSDNGRKESFTVIQHEGEARISVLNDKLSFGSDGGQQSITVNANFNWDCSASETWLRVSRLNDKLTVTCPSNGLAKKRTAEIYIYGTNISRTIYVTQAEGDTYFSVSGISDNTLHFGTAGGKNSALRVSCNDDWQVNNLCPWLNIKASGNSIIVQCEANPMAETRTASFEVVTAHERRTMTFLVDQSGAQPKVDKISLPERGGERKVSDVRRHFRTVYLKGDGGDMKVVVHSNVQNWSFRIVPDDENWMTGEASPKDSLLKLKLTDNNGWSTREADVIISAMGVQDTLRVRQTTRGYKGILDDYFENCQGTWKTTRFFIDLYAGGSMGFRIGGLAKRWKFVEFSLLDFDVEYTYRVEPVDHLIFFKPSVEYANNQTVQALFLDWEPMVRGFLPLSRDKRRWSVYMGMGISVNMLSLAVSPDVNLCYRKPHFLFEVGTEFHWAKKDNVSSRIFYRYDGYSSIGFSFDFYKWTKQMSE